MCSAGGIKVSTYPDHLVKAPAVSVSGFSSGAAIDRVGKLVGNHHENRNSIVRFEDVQDTKKFKSMRIVK